MTRALMWFREDLRVKDNMALSLASNDHEQVIAVYVIDHQMWREHDIALCRIEFILRNLNALQEALQEKNIPLLILEINKSSQIISIFHYFISIYKVDGLYFNQQYELNEVKRDEKLKTLLSISVHSFTDQIIFPPKDILTQNNTPYTIFTPYKRNFLQAIEHSPCLAPIKTIAKCAEINAIFYLPDDLVQQGIVLHTLVPSSLGNKSSVIPADYWPGGENAAHKRLQKFIREDIEDYQKYRDFPAYRGTSKLSAYLANGVLSPRQCFSAAKEARYGRSQETSVGIDTWISELVWREFYKQIMANFPRICKHQAFKEDTDRWPWRHDEKLFKAWKDGETGYPFIDAAMRQLQQTGWMHNRLRMVVAMFLTKDCFIDWRWGEKYFMQHLIDGDLAANNGGWQWAASTGCDAAPYFRVFSPIRQSERFDPDGEFIKQYCPELSQVDSKNLHDPNKLPKNIVYAKPIVSCKNTRAMLSKLIP